MVIDSFGGPEVLHWADLPKPEPGAGEVLVRVAFAGVNPADCKTRRGMLSRFFDPHFPFVLGFDLAGTVEAVGAGVTAWQPGDRVFGMSRQGQGGNGSYAEYTTAYAAMLARVPDGLALSEAAAMPTAGTTAYGGLVDAGGLRAGQSLLVHGGAGGIGSIAIQVAKASGARVAVTCAGANVDHVKGLGADLAIDYRTADVPTALRRWAPEGVDLVLDAVGLDTLRPRATEIVKPGGSYVEIETLESSASQDEIADAARQGVRIVSNMVAISRLHEHLAALAVLMSQGKVRMPALQVIPLGEASGAHERLARRGVRGKIVLEVGGTRHDG
jgi:NADPH:quinone reductase-like Zn-dependent oxidoreductase